jgi:hypothetical protein
MTGRGTGGDRFFSWLAARRIEKAGLGSPLAGGVNILPEQPGRRLTGSTFANSKLDFLETGRRMGKTRVPSGKGGDGNPQNLI